MYKGVLYETKKGKGLSFIDSSANINYKGLLKKEPYNLVIPSNRPASQRCTTPIR